MGKIKTDMEELVNKVRSSVAARHAGVRQVLDEAHRTLTQDRQERHARARGLVTQAQALGTRLAQQGRDRVNAAREAKRGLGRVAAGRRSAVCENRSRMSGHLTGLRQERSRMSGEFRQSVQEEVADIRAAVGTLKDDVQTMMSGIAADVQSATHLWRNAPEARSGKPVRQAKVAPAPPAAAAAKEPAQPSKPGKRERVLGIVRAHEDGIRLVDIGNELGVDWRTLVGVTKSLLEEGAIEKLDCLYYPVED
jgi:hypothetical protein